MKKKFSINPLFWSATGGTIGHGITYIFCDCQWNNTSNFVTSFWMLLMGVGIALRIIGWTKKNPKS